MTINTVQQMHSAHKMPKGPSATWGQSPRIRGQIIAPCLDGSKGWNRLSGRGIFGEMASWLSAQDSNVRQEQLIAAVVGFYSASQTLQTKSQHFRSSLRVVDIFVIFIRGNEISLLPDLFDGRLWQE